MLEAYDAVSKSNIDVSVWPHLEDRSRTILDAVELRRAEVAGQLQRRSDRPK
jgi:hypothetical protein